MFRTHTLCSVLGVITVLAASAPATAADAPKDFCGMPSGEPAVLQQAVTNLSGIKEIFKDSEYIAYQDPATEAVYTFSQPNNNAHPAAVCRKPVKVGETLTLHMEIVCTGHKESCDILRNDFNMLNERMKLELEKQMGTAKP